MAFNFFFAWTTIMKKLAFRFISVPVIQTQISQGNCFPIKQKNDRFERHDIDGPITRKKLKIL